MLGRGLIRKVAAVAAMAAAVAVCVGALGFALYAALALVLIPAGAAAVTALVFAGVAGVTGWLALGKATPDDEPEPAGLGERAMELFRTRPILGTAAGLAAAFIFLRNPALATMVAAAFTEKSRGGRR